MAMPNVETVYGVDFSGSKSPGNAIWITEGKITERETLEVTSTQSAKDRLEETEREAVLEGLCTLIRDEENAVFGLDFPFGFPKDASDTDDWKQFLENFVETFEEKDIDAYPDTFGGNCHGRREIDCRYAGQSPFSPQIKYQVFYGLRDVIGPLVLEGDGIALPMQSGEDSTTALIEVYPAATFGRLCLYRTGYKGYGEDSERRRKINAEGLQEIESIETGDSIVEQAASSDDALDSLCAAVATWRAIRDDFECDESTVEGHIFV